MHNTDCILITLEKNCQKNVICANRKTAIFHIRAFVRLFCLNWVIENTGKWKLYVRTINHHKVPHLKIIRNKIFPNSEYYYFEYEIYITPSVFRLFCITIVSAWYIFWFTFSILDWVNVFILIAKPHRIYPKFHSGFYRVVRLNKWVKEHNMHFITESA